MYAPYDTNGAVSSIRSMICSCAVHHARDTARRERDALLHDVRLGQRAAIAASHVGVVDRPAEHDALPAVVVVRLEHEPLAVAHA